MTRQEAIIRIKDHMVVHKLAEYPHGSKIAEALTMATIALQYFENAKKLEKALAEDFFYPYNFDEVFERDAVDYHCMTAEHAEMLGQFLDCTGMSVDDLKFVLIRGYIEYRDWYRGGLSNEY